MKFSRFLLLAVIGLLVSCNTNLDQPDNTDQTPEEFSIIGTIEPITRLAYTDSDNYMECRWEIGDRVDIANDKITHHFIVSKVADDNRAILTYDGTRLYPDKDFVGKATYRVDAPDGQIVQAANGVVSGNAIYGKDNATAHLKYGETLVADVKGLTAGMEIVFRHTEASAYRIVITAPVAFNPGEATLKMTIDDKSSEIELGFGAEKGETIVAYMLGKEATISAGQNLVFDFKAGSTYKTLYSYKVPIRNTTTFEPDNFWLADIRSFTPEETILIEGMTLEEKVGQLFIVRPEQLITNGNLTVAQQHGGYGLTHVSSTAGNLADGLASYPVGGIILFAKNIETKSQLMSFISDYKQLPGIKPFIAVDEEGGLVARVANSGIMDVEKFTSMKSIGNTGNTANAKHAGEVIGSYLNELGFNLDFAPVADVHSNASNKVIGDRSFSSNATTVSNMVGAFLDGLHEHNVLSTIKHFPGHGDTSTDSHTSLPLVTKTWSQLLALEIKPFKQNFGKTDLVMTAHIAVSTVNETYNGNTKPSTLSSNMITGKLRGELGYQGIVITDGMEMAAVKDNYAPGVAAKMAINAGCDIILAPWNLPEAYNAVLDAVQNGTISEARIDQSVQRILDKKNRIH